MITLLIFATTPWSQVAMTEVVIKEIPRQIASPLVVTTTISWFSSIPSSYLEEEEAEEEEEEEEDE